MKKILLIEDDPFLIDIYSTKMKEVGFKLDVADNGKTALKLLSQKEHDLIILDIVLPHIDGWELLGKIRSQKKFKNLPVIVLSNLGQKQEVKKGLELGATKYLIKAHYTPTEIIEQIKEVLK